MVVHCARRDLGFSDHSRKGSRDSRPASPDRSSPRYEKDLAHYSSHRSLERPPVAPISRGDLRRHHARQNAHRASEKRDVAAPPPRVGRTDTAESSSCPRPPPQDGRSSSPRAWRPSSPKGGGGRSFRLAAPRDRPPRPSLVADAPAPGPGGDDPSPEADNERLIKDFVARNSRDARRAKANYRKNNQINYRDEYHRLAARLEILQKDFDITRAKHATSVTYTQRLTFERTLLRTQIVNLLGLPMPTEGAAPAFFGHGGPVAVAYGAAITARYEALLATLQPTGGAAGVGVAPPGGATAVTPVTPQPGGAAPAVTPDGLEGRAGPLAPPPEELDMDLDDLFRRQDGLADHHIGGLLDPDHGLATPMPFTPELGSASP